MLFCKSPRFLVTEVESHQSTRGSLASSKLLKFLLNDGQQNQTFRDLVNQIMKTFKQSSFNALASPKNNKLTILDVGSLSL